MFRLFQNIRESFGSDVLRTVRKYVKIGIVVTRYQSHLWLNHECIRLNALPRSLMFKSPINNHKRKEIARKFGCKYLKLRIEMLHKKITSATKIIEKLVLNC